jgi:hypothetical protein
MSCFIVLINSSFSVKYLLQKENKDYFSKIMIKNMPDNHNQFKMPTDLEI